jgi:hypothetical protein
VSKNHFEKLRDDPGLADGSIHERIATVAEIERGHEAVLGEFLIHPGRWLVWIKVPPTPPNPRGRRKGRHLWFVLFEDGDSVIAEASSNQVLDEDSRLSETQEEQLFELGWREPDPLWTYNWFVELSGSEGIRAIASLASQTLRDVFGLEYFDAVAIGFQRRYLKGDAPRRRDRSASSLAHRGRLRLGA